MRPGQVEVYQHSWSGGSASARAVQTRGQQRLEEIRPHLEMARAAGCYSLRQIAAYLNASGHCGAKGGPWCASQVRRTLHRLERYDAQSLRGAGPADVLAVYEQIQEARSAGYTSLREFAAFVTAKGILAPRGRAWNAQQIKRFLNRYERDFRGLDVDDA